MRLECATAHMLSELTEKELRDILDAGSSESPGKVRISGVGGQWVLNLLDSAEEELPERIAEEVAQGVAPSSLYSFWWSGVIFGYAMHQIVLGRARVVH